MKDNRFAGGDAFSYGDIPIGIFTYRWYAMDIESGQQVCPICGWWWPPWSGGR